MTDVRLMHPQREAELIRAIAHGRAPGTKKAPGAFDEIINGEIPMKTNTPWRTRSC
jgi:hypothetical protein